MQAQLPFFDREDCIDFGQNQAMDTIGKRVRTRRLELGLTQVQLARKAGMKQGTISDLERGRNDSTMELIGLSVALNCRPEWLRTGKGDKIYGLQDAQKESPNVGERQEIASRIPLISWVRAGAFCQVVDIFEPGDAEEWLPTLHTHGPHAYALRVDGDSMVNPNPLGKTYPPGCIVYVEPDMPITNGCRVIAKIPSEEKATFKVFVEDAGRRYLRPLNPTYPTIEMTEGMLICGVVVGKYEKE